MNKDKSSANQELFQSLKDKLLNLDPVAFVEKYLTLDGKKFSLTGNGYAPFREIYRYVGVKALELNGKPTILVKGRQIGASTMSSALEMYFMGSGIFGTGDKPPIRVIHTFPQLEMAAAYSKTKLNQIINASLPIAGSSKEKSVSYMQSLLDRSSPTNDSLTFKQFIGGNHIWIESTGLDADRLRGRTADVMLIDECQKTSDVALGNALKILTAAKYGRPSKGVQLLFGTPTRKGSGFHKMWQSSSQQYYHLGCDGCKKYFPLYTPESNDWEKIWIHGFIVKCPHCKKEQNKLDAAERGKWIATRDVNDPNCLMVGFHLNQLYMPMFSREDIDNERPGSHPINTERVYQNEVLGEFFQGDSSPITADEIRENCADFERKFSKIITPSENTMVFMGIDYGSKSDLEQLANPEKMKTGVSYSTAVILSVKGANLLSIEFCHKFKKNDINSKKELIEKLMRDYSVNLAVGDIGYSNDFSGLLYNIFGDKYLVSRASGSLNGHIKFFQDTLPKEIRFEHSYFIHELYEQLKKGQVRFPFGDYERVAWLIDHICSMELKASIPRNGGDPSIRYVKGSTPNDGFMALLNAYLAYKFYITKGFTQNNPFATDFNGRNADKLPITLGRIKRRL